MMRWSAALAFCWLGLATAAGQSTPLGDPELAAAMQYLDSLGLPIDETTRFVRATTGEEPTGVAVHGFLAEDRGTSFTVWVSVPVGWPGFPRPHHATGHPLARWTLRRTRPGTARERRIGYEVADLTALARAALDAYRARTGPERGPAGAPSADRVFCARGLYATELCLLAWGVHQTEPDQQALARDLLEAAREAYPRAWYRPERPASLRGYLEVDLGHAAFWELLEDFGDRRVTRTELRARADTINRLYPDHPHHERAAELERLLRDSLRVARSWPPLDQVDRLVDIDTQARALVFHLEDQNGIQLGQPGGPDIWADPRGADSPAHRLLALGIDAIPALLDAVDDPRPSRTVGFHRNFFFSHRVIPVGDIAWTVVREIAGRGFADLDAARRWLGEVEARGFDAVLAEATVQGTEVGVVQGSMLRERAPQRAVEHLVAGASNAADDAVRARYLALLAPDLERPEVERLVLALLDDPATAPHSRLIAALLAIEGHPERAIDGLVRTLRDGLATRPDPVETGGRVERRVDEPSAESALHWLLVLRGEAAITAITAVVGPQSARPGGPLVASLATPSHPDALPLAPSFTEALQGRLARPTTALERGTERLLREWLSDPRDLGDLGDLGDDHTIADLAAEALAARWPGRYHFDPDAPTTDRAAARQAMRAVPLPPGGTLAPETRR